MTITGMDFERDLEINTIFPDVRAMSKKAALMHIADHIADTLKLSAPALLDTLIVQETRTSSGIGDGIAIPTLTLKQARKPYTVLMRLTRPIDFEAIDAKPVDLICVVISPENEGPYSLRRLSRLTRLLKNTDLAEKIRSTNDEETIRALIHNPDGWMLAA